MKFAVAFFEILCLAFVCSDGLAVVAKPRTSMMQKTSSHKAIPELWPSALVPHLPHQTASTDELERRREPLLHGKAVTYSEMVDVLSQDLVQLDDVQLKARWQHLEKVDGDGVKRLRLRARKPRKPRMLNKAPAAHPSFNFVLHSTKVDQHLVRPSAGKGADVVNYGLMVMNFYGATLKKHTFSVDMVMSLKWKDPRVIDFVPAGLDKVTVAWNQALEHIWMPGIVVTNREIKKYEIVSASVTVFRSGSVLRVERAQARIMQKYKLKEYPFDTQKLQIKIASSKYMLNELKLVAEKDMSDVKENVFGLYDLKGWEAHNYTTSDGHLKKSRGVLDFTVKRNIEKYRQDHLAPSFIVLAISWGVFYFPFVNQFIVARLALSILTLLTFTNLMGKSSKELPGAAPFNFNDLFNQQIQTLMFLTIVLNISSEISFHQFKDEVLARYINNSGKVVLPSIGLANIIMILGSGQNKWLSLETVTILAKVSVAAATVCYSAYVLHGVYHNRFKGKSDGSIETLAAVEGQEEADADADAGDGGDADCDM